MGGKAKNIKQTCGFLRFLALLGGLKEVSEASSGLSWTMLARGLCFSEVFWTCWRQEGEQQGQDGDMMAPGWVMIVPRWGMIVARWAF